MLEKLIEKFIFSFMKKQNTKTSGFILVSILFFYYIFDKLGGQQIYREFMSELLIESTLYVILSAIYFSSLKRKNLVERTIEQSNIINQELEKIRQNVKADYISISMFHNGTVTFSNIHLLKASRLFESYDDEKVISRISTQTTESIPLLPFYQAVLKMKNKGFIYVENADDEHKGNELIKILRLYDVKSAVYVPIYQEKELIGFICAEYMEQKSMDQKEINGIVNSRKFIEHFFK